MGTPDMDAQIGVYATLLVALVFSQRFELSKKAGPFRFLFTIPAAAAAFLGISTIWGWATGELPLRLLQVLLYIGWFAMAGALIGVFSAWLALPGEKLKGDPFILRDKPKPKDPD